ncbi:MAG: hypothetical protein RL148_1946 [Planctomycetota bacterium]
MTMRFATVLLALALPVLAQDPAAVAAETSFYKAFYLEKGERDFAGAMTLYAQFLAANPDHKLAKVAAEQNYGLLTRTGKAKEAEEFKTKYGKLLSGRATAPAAQPAAQEPAQQPPAGEGPRNRGAEGQGREQMAQRLERMKEELNKAKESGDTAAAERLEAQIKRMEEGAARGGEPGQAGPGGRQRMQVKFADMTKEQLDEFKGQRLDMMTGMIDRLRENGQEERATQLEKSITDLKAALDAGKTEDAQKIWDTMSQGMRRGRGGEAGGAGGGAGGAGGTPPGGTGGRGNRGGGGGGNGGGGGGGGI